MKLFFTALALAVNAANNDGTADALRSPSLVTADLAYVADDADDVDASSSHQNDVIANQAHVADDVSAQFSELLSKHVITIIVSHIYTLFAFAFELSFP